MKIVNKIFRLFIIAIDFLSLLLLFIPIFKATIQNEMTYISAFSIKTLALPYVIFCIAILVINAFVQIIFEKKKHVMAISFGLNAVSATLLSFSVGVLKALSTISNDASMTPFLIVFIVLIFVCSALSLYLANENLKYTVKQIVEAGMLVGLAILLDQSFLKIRIVQNGGSISFSMLPLIILSYRQGPIKGFIASGIVYGLLTCLLDGWGMQYFFFDYFLGYGAIGICGAFRNLIFKDNKYSFKVILFMSISIIISLLVRVLMSTISGVIFYEMSFVASLIYNFPYIMISGAFCLAAMIGLYKPMCFINSKI